MTRKRTPLYEIHVACGARMVPFVDWDMPLAYSGTLEEHQAVRQSAGLFDISHMGRLRIRGPQAEEGIQRVVTRDLRKVVSPGAVYSFLCNPQGGILDDIVLYRETPNDYLMVVNASNRLKISGWLEKHLAGLDLQIADQTGAVAMLALQGPAVPRIFPELDGLKPWRFQRIRLLDQEVMLARTGYTGEPGAEIMLPSAQAAAFWKGLMERGRPEGLKPAGLGARDLLRLEMGYALYGNDIDEGTTPLDADLAWAVDFQKPDFIGKQALQAQAAQGVQHRLIGFQLRAPGVPRQGHEIHLQGKPSGRVTSGNLSPMLRCGIGMGYVPVDCSRPGTELLIATRKKKISAVIIQRPFYRKKTGKPSPPQTTH